MSFEDIRDQCLRYCKNQGIDVDAVDRIITYSKLGHKLYEWSKKYTLQPEHVLLILDDQKVIPMIRGKASEYVVYDTLQKTLDCKIWKVIKPNINPQPNLPDQDIVVRHIETQKQFVVEVKNTIRGAIRLKDGVLKLSVKCHKSRSYIGRETNDRYLLGDFDFVCANTSNAFIQNGKYELIDDEDIVEVLCKYYHVQEMAEVIPKAICDIRFAHVNDILHSDGISISRVPRMNLNQKSIWHPISEFEKTITEYLDV